MRIILLLAIALLPQLINAQKVFEGFVNYQIEYLSVPDEVKGFESMLPQEMTKYMSGSKMRVEQTIMGEGTQIVISDSDANTGTVLMNVLGTQIAMVIDGDEMADAKEEKKKQKVKITKETKKIAGYKCKKAIVEMEGMDAPVIVWFTNEFKSSIEDYNKIDGLVLSYTSLAEGMQMRLTAEVVQKEGVDSSMFEIPDGYDVVTQDELMKMFGQ